MKEVLPNREDGCDLLDQRIVDYSEEAHKVISSSREALKVILNGWSWVC